MKVKILTHHTMTTLSCERAIHAPRRAFGAQGSEMLIPVSSKINGDKEGAIPDMKNRFEASHNILPAICHLFNIPTYGTTPKISVIRMSSFYEPTSQYSPYFPTPKISVTRMSSFYESTFQYSPYFRTHLFFSFLSARHR